MSWIKNILWAIFGNDEEWPPPGWYRPEETMWRRKVKWLLFRNPLHNFTWHVIGFVGHLDEWKKSGAFPNDVWNPNGGWNKIIYTHKMTGRTKIFRSYRGKRWEFYFGPRERGNYGAAFRRAYS